MLRGLQGLALAALVTVAFGGSAGAGVYSPPPGDSRPVWSPDGTVLVYATTRAPSGLHVLRPNGVEQGTLPGIPPWTQFAFSPDWRYIAYTLPLPTSAETALVVSRPDGSDLRRLVTGGPSDPAWSPDGTRLAFTQASTRSSGGPPDLYTVAADGSGLRMVAENAFDPSFSPDGSRIVYSTHRQQPERWDVAVVPAAGGATRLVTRALPDGFHLAPRWAPDGERLAFTGRGYLGVIAADGSGLRRYALGGQPGPVEWAPDGKSVLLSGFGIFRLELETGRTTKVSQFGHQAALSPDGSTIAFAGGGECKDRIAIYRVAATGGQPKRLTNDCRIQGTDGRDRLRGTELADVILGLGGDDVLRASDGAYQGDDLYGGSGDDVLLGDFRTDLLEGGPGRDSLSGNPGPDTLRGGPGEDVLSADGGKDFVFAEDGERDTVSCGTNRPGNGRDFDIAFVDRRDRVASDCELVYRGGRIDLARGRTRLAIAIWNTNEPREKPRIRTLRCKPAGGTLPEAATACRRLASMRTPLAPVAPGTQCAPVWETQRLRAQVDGVFAGTRLVAFFNRYNDCERARWARHAFLFRAA